MVARRARRLAFLVMASLVMAMTVTTTDASAAVDQTAVIVVLRDDAHAPSVAAQHAAAHGADVANVYQHALSGYAARVPAQRLSLIASDPRVLFISADNAVWAVDTIPTGVDRIEGDLSSQQSGNGSGSVGVAIAIIDTGSGPHSDLNVVGGKNCSTGRKFDDGNGHGTHVAGTVAARDNGVGVVGVAPGAPIYSVRVLNNQGSGSFSSIICGIDWVTANAAALGIKVANMSLGGSGSDDGNCGNSNNDALHKAICRSVAAGVTYVVAAGNSNADFAGFVPAAYDEVLTVTALADFNGQPGGGAAPTCRADVDETAADFSNFTTTTNTADQAHTIAAPGVCILSTWRGGGLNTISGTSMASPHVAGTVALCLSSGSCSGTPSTIIAKLRADAQAETNDPTNAVYYGFTDDPNSPNGNRHYGHLVYAGGY